MSGVFQDRSRQDGGKAAGGDNKPPEPPRLRLDVPLGTSFYEIQESIFRQAWQLAGSQLRAAIALGITPETISRFLRRCDCERIGRPQVLQAWPGAAPTSRVIGSSPFGPKPPGDGAGLRPSAQSLRATGRAIDSENPSPYQPLSGKGVIERARERANRSFAALIPATECAEEEASPSSAPDDDSERNEF